MSDNAAKLPVTLSQLPTGASLASILGFAGEVVANDIFWHRETPFVGSVPIRMVIPIEQKPDTIIAIKRNLAAALGQVYGQFSLIEYGVVNTSPEPTESEQVFKAIQALYLSNKPQMRRVADRVTSLHRAASMEGDRIDSKSLSQFQQFFFI